LLPRKALTVGWFKRRKSRSSQRSILDRSAGGHALLRGVVWLMALAVVAGGTWLGMRYLERYALGRRAGSTAEITAVHVAFTDRPDWMPLGLASDIAEALVPPRAQFSPDDLTASIYRLAIGNPHVAEVRHVTWHATEEAGVAMVEIDCRFRMPIARVDLSGTGWGYAYVDRDGYRLPDASVPQWMVQLAPTPSCPKGANRYFRDGDPLPDGAAAHAVHYIVLRGVAAPAPPVGQQWPGRDIQDGLRLAELVLTRSYANQISVVDVRNHEGRISHSEPYLRMYAQMGNGPVTDIRFGRFPAPSGGDYEVSPEVKMSHLDDYFLDHGRRLAGMNSYIDLQYDQLIYSIN
jgi:hypothetical protein